MANVKTRINDSAKLAEGALALAAAQGIKDRDDILELIIKAAIKDEKDGKIEVSANDFYMAVHAAYKLGKYFAKKDAADHLSFQMRGSFKFD